MRQFRALLFAVIFYPGTLLFVLAGIGASAIGTNAMRSVVHGWADFHHRLVRRLLGIDVEIEGFIPTGPHLIAVKHQSMFETIEVLRIARTPVVVIKRELSDLPLFGWLTRRYGVIPVDRDAGAKALRKMLVAGRSAAAAGRPVVIFPEGTRVAVGQQPPMGAGFAGLYRMLGLPVVPIAMDSGRLWGKDLPIRAGTIHFRIGEPIAAGLKREEIESKVHAAINALEGSGS